MYIKISILKPRMSIVWSCQIINQTGCQTIFHINLDIQPIKSIWICDSSTIYLLDYRWNETYELHCVPLEVVGGSKPLLILEVTEACFDSSPSNQSSRHIQQKYSHLIGQRNRYCSLIGREVRIKAGALNISNWK